MNDLEHLSQQRRDGHEFIVIHYATQSFYAAKDEPIAISAVAFHFVKNAETRSFSRADAPEDAAGTSPEQFVLQKIAAMVADWPDATFLHWNMNRAEFGFSALEKRRAFVWPEGSALVAPHDFNDVDELVKSQFGHEYAPHPRLESLAKLNSSDRRSFKTGKEEADLFEVPDWQTIGRSCAAKARIIGEVFEALLDRSLRTANSGGSVDFAGSPLDAVATLLQIGDRYLDVLRTLSKRGHGRAAVESNDEYDDQYIIHSILALFFSDIRPEEYTPSYAAGSSRIDFLLPDHGLAIELKHCRPSMTDKGLADELIVDKARYAGHPKVSHLVALVVDAGRQVLNPRGLEKELSETNSSANLTVTVKIIDR